MGWSRKFSIILVVAVTAAVGIFVEGSLLSPWMDSISIYAIPLGTLLAGITMFRRSSDFDSSQIQKEDIHVS